MKFLVINGLARSGTTMIERLIDSQENMISFGQLWELPTLIAENTGGYKAQILKTDYSAFLHTDYLGDLDIERSRKILTSGLASYLDIKLGHAHYDRPETEDTEAMLNGLPISAFDQIKKRAENTTNADEIRNPLRLIEPVVGDNRVIATKWNMCHRYSSVFLRDPDAYWLEIVRDPKTRFASFYVSHKIDPYFAIFQSNDLFNGIRAFNHPRHLVVRYEDLTNDLTAALQHISSWLGEEIKDVELVNHFGMPFRPNTSQNALSGKDVEWQNPDIPAQIKRADGPWRDAFLKDGTDYVLDRLMVENRYYQSAPYQFPYVVKGWWKLARVMAKVKSLFILRVVVGRVRGFLRS